MLIGLNVEVTLWETLVEVEFLSVSSREPKHCRSYGITRRKRRRGVFAGGLDCVLSSLDLQIKKGDDNLFTWYSDTEFVLKWAWSPVGK